MPQRFLCGGEKYELGGPQEDTIGLPVFPTGLPPRIQVEGYTLSRKTSFHVSLVCIGKIAEKQNLNDPELVHQIATNFCDFTSRATIELLHYRNEFRFVSAGEKRTVVVMCEVTNLDKFFDLINMEYGLKLEYPPTHVTLYNRAPYGGIFLTDSADIQQLTKQIRRPNGVSI